MSNGNIWMVVVVVVFAALLLPAVNIAYSDSLVDESVDAEEMVLEFQEPVAVDAADIAVNFDEDVTVRNAQNQNELTEGEDYEWNSSDGTVTALDEEWDSETVEIDYSYETQTETTRDLRALGEWINPLVAYGLFTLVVFGAVLGLASVID